MENFDAPSTPAAPPSNLPEFTVTELSFALKREIETAFPRCACAARSASRRSRARAMLFPPQGRERRDRRRVLEGHVPRLGIKIEEGHGGHRHRQLTTYAGSSRYQIIVDRLELAGEGALLKLLEERRKKLAAEGLFDAERKRALPFLPEVIGVVTSPTGAVIRDILHRLSDRFPRRVLVWPVAVQGEKAAGEVAAAIAGFNRLPEQARCRGPTC